MVDETNRERAKARVFRKVGVVALALALIGVPAAPRVAQAAEIPPPSAPVPIVPPALCTDTVGPGVAPIAATEGLSGAHAALYARSGIPTLCPGSTTTVTIAFENTGSLGWYGNAALGTWGPDPGQDKASALAVGWPTANRAAIQTTPYLGPGPGMWVQFRVEAPTTPGTYKLGLRPGLEGPHWPGEP